MSPPQYDQVPSVSVSPAVEPVWVGKELGIIIYVHIQLAFTIVHTFKMGSSLD